MSQLEWKKDFLARCRKDREETLASIEFWSKPGAMIGTQDLGGEMKDVTDAQIADLRRIVERMDKLIAVLERDLA